MICYFQDQADSAFADSFVFVALERAGCFLMSKKPAIKGGANSFVKTALDSRL